MSHLQGRTRYYDIGGLQLDLVLKPMTSTYLSLSPEHTTDVRPEVDRPLLFLERHTSVHEEQQHALLSFGIPSALGISKAVPIFTRSEGIGTSLRPKPRYPEYMYSELVAFRSGSLFINIAQVSSSLSRLARSS